MQDPDTIAIQVVRSFSGDEYWIDTNAAIDAVAIALRAYGAECAAQERERAERQLPLTIQLKNGQRFFIRVVDGAVGVTALDGNIGVLVSAINEARVSYRH